MLALVVGTEHFTDVVSEILFRNAVATDVCLSSVEVYEALRECTYSIIVLLEEQHTSVHYKLIREHAPHSHVCTFLDEGGVVAAANDPLVVSMMGVLLEHMVARHCVN